jgi:mannose-6-phosphate isomerase
MALALTPFRALCGFLPLSKIDTYLRSTPEFAALIPEPISTHFSSFSLAPSSNASKDALRSLFSALMTTDPLIIQKQLQGLVSRYQGGGVTEDEKGIADLVLLLNDQFPGDIGVFCAFMLNYVHLQPGEAIFLAAGEPHAYVSGGTFVFKSCFTQVPGIYLTIDIIECMANSDNVIRAGLTPKLRDIPNLLSGLAYSSCIESEHVIRPVSFPGSSASAFASGVADQRKSTTITTLYDPPIPEFSVLHTRVQLGDVETHRPIEGPSVAIVTSGRGTVHWGDEGELNVSPGHVFFVGARTEVKLEAGSDTGEPLVTYRAFVEAP